VWVPKDPNASPLPADVYAFGCLMFEVLTGEVLFDADQEVALVSSHLMHDGGPKKLERLAKVPGMAALAELVRTCLRRDPAKRVTLADLRKTLEILAPDLEERPWPIALSAG
jgi:serine/threonine protein kinase